MPGESKRRKVVVLSDSEEESVSSRLSQVSQQSNTVRIENQKSVTAPTTARPKSTTAQDRASKPTSSKPEKKTTVPKKEKGIYSFFNAATQRQGAQPSASPSRAATPIPEDLIQDDEETSRKKEQVRPNPLPLRRKRKPDEQGSREGSVDVGMKGSQAFKRTTLAPSRNSAIPVNKPQSDPRPWTERYAPVNLDELAVHKKKITEVRQWLERSKTSNQSASLLVLRGPAGCGKTQTLRLLADMLGWGIQEWKNPSSNGSAEDGYRSMSAQFNDFIGRAGVFGALDFSGSVSGRAGRQNTQMSAGIRDLVLIEEFPSLVLSASAALNNFRSSVLQYIMAASESHSVTATVGNMGRKLAPIVVVISETSRLAISDTNDAFTAHRLFGPEIMHHPAVTTIEFNPIAQTFMTKALDLVLTKDARVTARRKVPGSAIFQRLSELGDLRSAVMSLEFLCLQGDDFDWTGKVALLKNKKIAHPPSRFELQSLEILSQRESAIGIFHSLGRVLHNKRNLPGPGDAVPEQPPLYLPQFARSKVSEIDIDLLLNELGTDIDTFVGGLHENFVLSCQGIDNEETLDYVNGSLEVLSDADLLSPSRFGNNMIMEDRNRTGNQLRQDELAFHTAVRGLLFSLPHPVKRSKPPAGYKGATSAKIVAGGYQMYYPRSMQLWRSTEELRESAERLNTALQRDYVSTSQLSSFRSDSALQRQNGNISQDAQTRIDHVLPLSSGKAGLTLLLEFLPFLNRISSRKNDLISGYMRSELDKLIILRAPSTTSATEEDEDDDYVDGLSLSLPIGRPKYPKDTTQLVASSEQAENMVLEDDDIEDD